MGSVRSSGPVTSGTMFLSAGIFLAILLGMSAFAYHAEREQARVLREGLRTRVMVVEKQKDKKGTTSLLLRLSDVPEVTPFWRSYQNPDRDTLKPGDQLDYVYESVAPEAGVVGTPVKHNYVALVALILGVFVAPFLVIGGILKRRERAKAVASTA